MADAERYPVDYSVFENIDFHIRGDTPQLWHNARLADRDDPITRRMAAINAKGKKRTEKDFVELQNLEWEGSLYLDHEKRVIVPGTVIQGAFWEAAKKERCGADVRNGLSSDRDWRLIYPGPTDFAKLKADPNFRDRRIVVNPSTKGRVMRTRPIFREWELRFSVRFSNQLLSREQVIGFAFILGADIGLSDDRRMAGGRFTVLSPVPVGSNGKASRKELAGGRRPAPTGA